MSSLAIALLLLSAVLHATWNFLGKRQDPTASFMLAANTLGTLALAPLLILFWDSLGAFSAPVWGLIVLTGLAQAVYYVGLAGAYRAGDLSLAYPLVRAVPVLLVTLLTLLLEQGNPPSQQAVAGMVLIVAGCLILPLHHFGQLNVRSYASLAVLLALVAALGTVGYSILDDRALRLLRAGDGLTAGNLAVTLVYAIIAGISASLWLGAFVALRRQDRRQARALTRADLRQAFLVGLFIFVGYALVLVALALVPNVGYAVAFRQLSIPLGAVLAIVLLKEPAYRPRLLGVGMVFVGLVLVATG
jgi:drug/metabolite transporter (DMT)-like permease